MEEGTSLDDILGGTQHDEAPEQEAPQGQPRDEHGRFAPVNPPEEQGEQPPQGEQQEAPPASEPEPGHIPIAALKDERTKRQRAEDDARQARETLAQYEAYFQQLNNQQPAAQEEPDPIDYIAQEVLSRVQPQTQQQYFQMRVQVAEEFARQKWADYDEKVEVFKEQAQANPFLWRELASSPNPAEYAYNAASNIIAARSYGSAPPPSREQIEAEIREKIMAEIGMKQPQVPTSLASAQSRGSRGGPAWSGPTDINDILAR